MTNETRRVALITGANKGIGFEIADQLAAKDLIVLVGARDENKGIEARDKLRAKGGDAHYVNVDVADPVTIQAAMDHIAEKFKRLDVLINNAGILIDPQAHILDLDLNTLKNTLITNAFGPLLMSQASAPLMKRKNYGRIVNMASTLGSLTEMVDPDSDYAGVLSPAYRLSKTVLNGLTALLSKELRGTNILVNSACPGWVRTEMGGDQAPISPAQGAETPVWLATLPDDGPTGGFFREKQPIAW
jgi:NAD(P)-dependent dehydrogenase (short-subunit alcohol dehydrogenase family)